MQKPAEVRKKNLSVFKRKGFLWVTLGIFIVSVSAHWVFAWFSYVSEQQENNKPILASDYFNQTMRDTMENWQSEFLQLMWQVGALSFLWYVASPQSKEGDDRKEEKLDLILKKLDPENAKRLLEELDAKYPKK